eukprot:CAMPEP_0171379388 /NCGR_PEP_ID=MMETSP0879-20121228/26430_1 /TAXON_ID=67004 /ORGANISM="Thalassiosira weissflogii, Strain CCMP1336" /LENGTH=127 /DNA_ID=CAMNT_0011890141 /DNA_START=425 /DNA_END=808 /DNA_ORIENTATION=+
MNLPPQPERMEGKTFDSIEKMHVELLNVRIGGLGMCHEIFERNARLSDNQLIDHKNYYDSRAKGGSEREPCRIGPTHPMTQSKEDSMWTNDLADTDHPGRILANPFYCRDQLVIFLRYYLSEDMETS